jgi:hypothetical protein
MTDKKIMRIYCSGCGCQVLDWDAHEAFHDALDQLRKAIELITDTVLQLADK